MKIKDLIKALQDIENIIPEADIMSFSPNSGLTPNIVIEEQTDRWYNVYSEDEKGKRIFVIEHIEGE